MSDYKANKRQFKVFQEAEFSISPGEAGLLLFPKYFSYEIRKKALFPLLKH